MIIIAPFAQKLRNGKQNPKNPSVAWWKELISQLDGHIVQVGVKGEEQLVPDFRCNLPMPALRELLSQCDNWIGVDSFFQHLGWDEGVPGVVIWGPSDPLIFGHPENTNLLKDRKYLAPRQFHWWEQTEHQNERFVEPNEVIEHLRK